jgi:hypothetical protein
MRKILVSAISFVNERKNGSEIYTTFAKRLIDDVLTKTPWDIMVSTNRGDLFQDISSDRLTINEDKLENHKTHVGAFNQLLKFISIKDIDPLYDYVLYMDCDAGFVDNVNLDVINVDLHEGSNADSKSFGNEIKSKEIECIDCDAKSHAFTLESLSFDCPKIEKLKD